MTFIDDYQIKEIRTELFIDVLFFHSAGDGLIQRQINLVGLVGLPLLYFRHGRTERLEIVGHGLIDQDVAVGKEQDAFFGFRLPKTPNDLKGGEGLAGAGGHHQENTILTPSNGLHGRVDGQQLVIAWCLVAAVAVVILSNEIVLPIIQCPIRLTTTAREFAGMEIHAGPVRAQ